MGASISQKKVWSGASFDDSLDAQDANHPVLHIRAAILSLTTLLLQNH